ncbi:hypothetical protein [Pseudonocardia acidicola]|uniref:Uncharacterized protein n=1 Tax=Pseudonocardia acidicola TaxID=2724939 RepID=A0ABX1SBE2_9PSEU|nr:hypothetical protein [Pseudonocardia acidicola]NMH97564.1 hypothetical protein [Pseudonocardia acidicola]
MTEPVVQLRAGIAGDLAPYARDEVAAVLAHAGRPVLRVHVRVIRHGDPARGHSGRRERPRRRACQVCS